MKATLFASGGTAVMLLIVALLAPVVGALGTPQFESGGGWVAFRLTAVVGEPLVVSIGRDRSGGAEIGVEFRTPDHAEAYSMISPGVVTSLGASHVGESPHVVMESGDWEFSVEFYPENTETQVLFWATGAADSWWHAIESSATSYHVEMGSGAGSYFWTGTESTRGVHGHAVVDSVGASGTAAVYELRADGVLRGTVGLVSAGTPIPGAGRAPTSHESISVRFPDGSQEECLCFAGANERWVPGDYTFVWKGASAFVGEQPVLLSAVDAPAWLLD